MIEHGAPAAVATDTEPVPPGDTGVFTDVKRTAGDGGGGGLVGDGGRVGVGVGGGDVGRSVGGWVVAVGDAGLEVDWVGAEDRSPFPS